MQSEDSNGRVFGIISVVLGGITFGIQIIGGLCCGWLGWPLGIGAAICGILAMVHKEYRLGGIGIGLSVVGLLLQLLALGGAFAGLGHAISH